MKLLGYGGSRDMGAPAGPTMPPVVGFQEFAGAVKPLKPSLPAGPAILPNDGTIPANLYGELASVHTQAKVQQGLYFHNRLDGWIGACSMALRRRNEEVADHYQRWQAYEYNRWREEWHARNPRPSIKSITKEKPPKPPTPAEEQQPPKKQSHGPKLDFKFATNNAAALFIQRMWRGHRVRAMLAREKRLRARHGELAAASMFADQQAKQLQKKIDGSMETEAFLRRDIAALEMDNDARRKKDEATAKHLDDQDARIFTEQTKLLTRSIEIAEELENEEFVEKEQKKQNAALAFLGDERKADSAYKLNSLDRAYHHLRINWIEGKREKYREARLQAWAARLIQHHYRKAKKERMEAAWKAREDVIREKRAALLIQMYYRKRLQKKYAQLQILREQRLLAWAAVRIQRFYRERATERMLNLENRYRRRLGLTDATVILQSFFRMMLAKRLAARIVARLEESLASSRSSLARSLIRRSGLDIKKLVENGLRVYNEDLRLSQRLNRHNKYISRWERMRAEREFLKKLKKRVRGADDVYINALLTPYVDGPHGRSSCQAEGRASPVSPCRSPVRLTETDKSHNALEETLRVEVEHAFGKYYGMLRSSEDAFTERLDMSAPGRSLMSERLGASSSIALSTGFPKSIEFTRKSAEMLIHVEEEVIRAEDLYDRDLNAERTDLSPPPSSSKVTKAKIKKKQKKLQHVFEVNRNAANEASVRAEEKKARDKVRLEDNISHILAGAMDIYTDTQMDETESFLHSSGLLDSQEYLASASPSASGRQSVSILSEVSETGRMPSPTRFHARSYGQRKADHGMQVYADINEDVEEARKLAPHRPSHLDPSTEKPGGAGFKFFSSAKGGLASRSARYPTIGNEKPKTTSPPMQETGKIRREERGLGKTTVVPKLTRNLKEKPKKMTMVERLEKMTARTTSLYGQTLDIMQGGSGMPRHGGTELGEGTYTQRIGASSSKTRLPEEIKRDLRLLKSKQRRHETYMEQLAQEHARATKRKDQVDSSLRRSWKATTGLLSTQEPPTSPSTPRSNRHNRCHSPSSPYHSLDKSIRIRESHEIF